MNKQLSTVLLSVALVALMIVIVFTSIFTVQITSAPKTPAVSQSVKPATPEESAKQGFSVENGNLYYYNEDGTRFADGLLELTEDGQTQYYYFLPNGQAFTSGYKPVEVDGIPCAYFFQEDGTAFTDGLMEVTFGEESHLYYFQEDGRALTSDWITLQDGTYFFLEDGRSARDTFLNVDGILYRFDADAHLVTGGWFCLEEEEGYYYAGEDGALLTDTVFEGYVLDASGKSSTKYRIIQHVKEHTDPSMTDDEKIQALYDWVLTNSMTYTRSYEHALAGWTWKDSWVDDMAASQMDNWTGNCFRYAAFSGMLFREATGLPVVVYRGSTPAMVGGLTPHSWCTVQLEDQWYVYDVELNKFSVYTRESCYKIPEELSYIHMEGIGVQLYS